MSRDFAIWARFIVEEVLAYLYTSLTDNDAPVRFSQLVQADVSSVYQAFLSALFVEAG